MSKLALFKQNLASENMDVLTGKASLAIRGGKKSAKKSCKKSKKSTKYNCTPLPPVCACPPPPCGPGNYGNGYGNPNYYSRPC